MDLTKATIAQLEEELDRRSHTVPGGWELIDASLLEQGVHEVYDTTDPESPWRTISYAVGDYVGTVLVVAREIT